MSVSYIDDTLENRNRPRENDASPIQRAFNKRKKIKERGKQTERINGKINEGAGGRKRTIKIH